MLAQWALILVIVTGAGATSQSVTYFANRDLCEAARADVAAQLGASAAAVRCYLMGVVSGGRP